MALIVSSECSFILLFVGGFDRLHEEFGRAFAGGGIVIRNEARIVKVPLHKTEVCLLFVTVAPVNRDPLLMHVRKFLSCFALWVLRLQGYSQLHLYSIFEQLFCLPLIFGKG